MSEETKRSLVLGTRVKIKKENSCWDGQEGVIDAVFEPLGSRHYFGVHFKKQNRVICFSPKHLEVIYNVT